MKIKKWKFNPTAIIALGFLLAILVGAAILMLPFSSTEPTSITEALFTATTSVCVTGLVVVPTFSHWTIFGQTIILILIQIGGLGVITFTMMFLLFLKKRIGIRERMLIRDAYNLDNQDNLVSLMKRIVKGTLIVECAGALLYMPVFISDFGPSGIWKSFFNSISAFCNAGIDILGPDSLIPYQTNLYINLVTITLIVLGGIGFPIWWVMLDTFSSRHREQTIRWRIAHLSMYVKVVIWTTITLVFGGALLVFALEYNNPDTIGNLSFEGKLIASVFQSVTTRTAGFCSIPQEGMRSGTSLICCALMFIGGSPSGTAGGIKTTTIVILLSTVISIIKERNDTELFHRKVSANTIRRAMAIFCVSFLSSLTCLLLLCITQTGNFEDLVFEAFSAIGTAGLTRAFTGQLNTAGRLIIIISMYLGRIGPITLSLFFNTKKYKNKVHFAEEPISVG